ncbi:unnamed protein product [Paramecium primaurelia]|uniref:Uncharacterized protein n=1 Tax=Paramecium primaurelia TaxID=5886 RepID=A0A8S1Q1G9_PARPR|nr:unnamed protein product [Paramecium primaurelia]
MQNQQDSLTPFINNSRAYNFINNYDYAYKQNNLKFMQSQNQEYEIQKQKQNNDEEQVLIQYYVYQDFQNLINLLYSYQAVKNYFIDQPYHSAIILSRNKIILQLNISNSIHYDLQQTNKNTSGQDTLEKEKKNVKNILYNMKNDLNMKDLDNECLGYLNIYTQNSLAEYVQIKQIPLEQSNINYNFNQNVLDKVLPQISFLDEQIKQLRQRKQYHIPSESQIKQKAKEYQKITYNKLLINYPRNNYNLRSPSKQDYMSFQYEIEKSPKKQSNISKSQIYSTDSRYSKNNEFQNYLQ